MFIFDFSRVGENIKKYRKEAGLSQAALADMCGCASTTISAYEKGKVIPSHDKIVLIATALDRQPGDIVATDVIDDNTDIDITTELLDYCGYRLEGVEKELSVAQLRAAFAADSELMLIGHGRRFRVRAHELSILTNFTIEYFEFALNKLIQEKETASDGE